MPITDTPSQTREILFAIAEGGKNAVNFTPWHALQRWLEAAEHRIEIPYARALAELVPPLAVRLRRDFQAVLTLIAVSAILHQANCNRTADGKVIATLDDYTTVWELVADLVADSAEATAKTGNVAAVAADLVGSPKKCHLHRSWRFRFLPGKRQVVRPRFAATLRNLPRLGKGRRSTAPQGLRMSRIPTSCRLDSSQRNRQSKNCPEAARSRHHLHDR